MTRRDPLLVALEGQRRERVLLRARFAAANPRIGKDGKELDRTIGMHIPEDKEASKKYRAALKKAAKETPLSAGDLRQRCLDLTRRHV